MAKYCRLMLGASGKYADDCRRNGFVGVSFDMQIDLSGRFPDNWRAFNKEHIPIYLKIHPEKSRVAAGLACGTFWSLFNGYAEGDYALCPDGKGAYMVGRIIGNYVYRAGHDLPHQRKVEWLELTIQRNEMSEPLRNSAGAIGTLCDISKHAEELNRLILGQQPPPISVNDPTIEDSSEFAMEQHLEEFLVKNWDKTLLGKKYQIYEEDGEKVGRQYPSDTGPIDILAISKDKKALVVIELKKGRASDNVLGQIQRYMGYVKDELAEPQQHVCGIIIGYEKDDRLMRALSVAPNIDFYKYQISFQLTRD